MEHLQKFNEYYTIDPNFDGFENEVIAFAEEVTKVYKNIEFSELKERIIESFHSRMEFKYGDDFKRKLAIIDRVASKFIKKLDK